MYMHVRGIVARFPVKSMRRRRSWRKKERWKKESRFCPFSIGVAGGWESNVREILYRPQPNCRIVAHDDHPPSADINRLDICILQSIHAAPMSADGCGHWFFSSNNHQLSETYAPMLTNVCYNAVRLTYGRSCWDSSLLIEFQRKFSKRDKAR